MIGRGESMRGHGGSTKVAVESFDAAAQGCDGRRHKLNTLITAWMLDKCRVRALVGRFRGANGRQRMSDFGEECPHFHFSWTMNSTWALLLDILTIATPPSH